MAVESASWPQTVGAPFKLGWPLPGFVVVLCLLGSLRSLAASQSCSGREVLTVPSGVITDGQGDYPPSAHCEWLIQGNPAQFIMLSFVSMNTECAYDYLFIYDGDSYNSPLLGTFSGKTVPDRVLAQSGKMLIYFFSDRNYVLKGFYALYNITSCPYSCNGNGICNNETHTCSCDQGYTGQGCETQLCPNQCGENVRGVCNYMSYVCECNAGWFGHDCGLPVNQSATESGWHTVLPSTPTFLPRAGHAGAFVQSVNCLYVFGGNSLNGLFDDLVFYCFRSGISNAWSAVTRSDPWPAARHAHAITAIGDVLYMFGGILENGEHANDLWMFSATPLRWTRLAESSAVQPIAVAGHTLTAVDDAYLYLFGGRTFGGQFLADMYRIGVDEAENWERVVTRGGKESELHLVGHSAVFHRESRSLLVFGGFMTDNARFPKRKNALHAFQVDVQWWSELGYNALLPQAPKKRAFHQAVIIDNYMVIHGGNIHVHHEEETCYDDQLHFYHLGCHTWIDIKTMTRAFGETESEPMKGRYGHVAAAAFGNTILVAGGYRGSVLGDLMAYTVPLGIAKSLGDVRFRNSSDHCFLYRSSDFCRVDPECLWCSSGLSSRCLHRDNAQVCHSGLIQLSDCPGVCEALHSCDACVVQGQGAVLTDNSTVKGLMQKERCAWCVKEGSCQPEKDPRGVCNNSRSTASGLEGWWSGRSAFVTSLDQCWSMDYPAGLHWIKYRSPMNWSLPDEVNIVRNSSMNFQFNSMFDAENIEGTQYIAVYRGFVYPLGAPKTDAYLKMFLVTSAANAVIYVSNNSNPANKEKLAEVDMATYNAEQLKRPNQAPIFPDERRGCKYYVEDRVMQAVAGLANTQVASTMNLEWTGALVTPKRQRQSFTSEFLEPFTSNAVSCFEYRTCLACMTDTSCGWCVDSCIARNESEKSNCRTALDHPALLLNASHCSVCTDFVECSTCLEDEFCEWLIPEARCVRRGRFDWAVTNASNCPVDCLSRNNSAWCISDKNECAWCEQSQLCFAFVEYVLRYPYGSCNEWVDSLSIDPIEDCRLLSNCESCLGRYMCGWCGNADNPTIGVCHRGDFSGVNSTANCSSLISENHGLSGVEPALWSYEECPDVDECRHGMSSCHANASCINTHGSFTCICNRGFAGDAVLHCNRTCYHVCIHGHCSGPPDFECSCDIGWTGDDCSVDCGCNNHSTCDVAIGQCDNCQHNTVGPTCDRCVPGSYGNPKSVAGCHLCDCNRHGDPLLGVCDNSSGVCYCTDNTVGNQCENCSKDHYGNPRDGGHCYRMCDGRTIITRATSGALGSFRGSGTEGGHVFCLWILTVHEDLEDALRVPQNTLPTGSLPAIPSIAFTVGMDMQILCSQDYVFVYDGIPSYPGFLIESGLETDAQLLAAICGQNLDRSITILATSGSMTIFFEAIVGTAHVTRGFNATYRVHTCAEECRNLCTVDNDRCANGITKCDPTMCTGNRTCVGDVCECRDGFTGPDCSIELCPFNCSSGTGQGFCLEERCVCSPGFGGLGCSDSLGPTHAVYTPVLGPRQLNRTQNRIGHSLISCDDGMVYLFGGYAPGVGLLNDLWKYDPSRDEWTLLKPATNEEPDQRYYHAGVCIPNVHAFYIFGGIVARVGPTQDLWRYNLDSGRWNKLKVSENNGSSPPMPMAGHTMTLVDDIKVWVVGGFSSSSYFSESVFIYDAGSNRWTELADVPGARPTGLYGHSTVFHPPSQALYVFGGYVYTVDSASVSNVLYALDLKNRSASVGNITWTVLPAVNGNQPPERFFHGALQTEQFMVIAGGYSSEMSPESSVYVYRFYCNQWMNMTPTDSAMRDLGLTSAIGPLAASASGDVFAMSLSSGIPGQVLVRMTLPGDICGLFTDVHSCLASSGCNACSVKETKQFFCYSNAGPRPQGCMVQNTSVAMQSGGVCDVRRLENVDCQQFKTCSDCLARWPIFPNGGPKVCQWCSNCPVGRCILESDDCDKGSPCSRQQRDIHDSKDCLERVCQASNCDSCWGNPRCMWTRHIKRSRETDKSLSLIAMYDWNCISNIPLNVSSSGYLPETSPPFECPTRCYEFTTCGDCLRSTGAEGGAQSCVWSMQLGKCYPPAYLPLGCSVGQCGLIITQNVSSCPSRCSIQPTCSSCLQTAHCGWCAINGLANGGQGVCMEGGLLGPIYGQCTVGNVSLGAGDSLSRQVLDWLAASLVPPTWSFTLCPLEDECKNGHSRCDPIKEKCINQANGYTCECQSGFIMNESRRTCEPFCRQGCQSGSCVMPNTCRCNFGFVGANCSTECQCNKHSDCRSVTETNVCLSCQNNTKGKNCSECQFLFVGNPENGGRCNSCFDLCNQHSQVCLAKGYFSSTAENLTNLITNENAKTLFSGPKSAADTVCWNCSNNTQGPLCQECRNGYFRLKDRPLTEPCQICECNGHSDVCDKEKGDNCDCKNNTKSPRCDSSDALKSCYKLQCSQCVDNFLGTPTDGHQCYRQMTVDREMCIDPLTQMTCGPNHKPNPLHANRTIFFAVQPRFQNVDIRLFLDVTKGGLDLYFSPLDNTYKVSVDPLTGVHVVSIDSIHKYSRNYADLLTTDPRNRRRRAEPRDFFSTVAPSAVTSSTTETASPVSNKTTPDDTIVDRTYFLDERTASGPVTFISVAHPDTFLVVRGIRNRLVLMLPNTVHNLKISRFYLIVLGVGGSDGESALTSGLLYYRQDQPHIDLFVFFSVFFSCFFLFLAVCVIVWKTKQMIDMQRTRHRRQLEMEHMASRPFARSLVLFDAYPLCVVTPPVVPRRRVTKTNSKYALATSAYSSGGVHPATEAAFHINPLALEPTCDGTAVVSTFMFQLPGGDAAPVRACLGSVLVSTRIMYPNLHHTLPKGSTRSSRQGAST